MVTLLSTAFQSENTTLEELFDCLVILYKFEPDLLIEKAAAEERLLSKISKLGCVVRMVIDSILLHAECGPNDHRKDAPRLPKCITDKQAE